MTSIPTRTCTPPPLWIWRERCSAPTFSTTRRLPGDASLVPLSRRAATGTYGAGITRHLALSGIPVLEGPDPASRRAKGKDDTLDAIAAAEAARTRRRVQVAKDRSGAVEALRVLRTTRKTAIKCRRAALQQLHNTIVAAPEEVRDQVRNLTRMRRLRTCAAWRPDAVGYRDPVVATKLSLKYLARRILDLNDEIAELDRFIVPLVEELAPSLLELEGVGTENAGAVMVAVGDNPDRLRSEASFAMMCGVCPIPASSGKTQRHRLNRGGNRQANSALHMVAVCRMRTDQRTRAYVAREPRKLSKREIMRPEALWPAKSTASSRPNVRGAICRGDYRKPPPPWHQGLHEPQGELPRQRPYGELLWVYSRPNSRTDPVFYPARGQDCAIRVHRDLL